MPDPVLVTGGAGYIGSHVVVALSERGVPVVVIDDLSTGTRAFVPDGVPFVEGDAGDRALLRAVAADHGCRSVMHFAGSIIVPESVENPLLYYRNNTVNAATVLDVCVEAGLPLVFSSTAAVYGSPARVPVAEDAPVAPESPYGWSKAMSEQMIRDAARAHALPFAILRYFNVAGADPEGRTGQGGPNATHLIKVACAVALGHRASLPVYGRDYDTPDGTCVRDFIHVSDLAEAHVLALGHILETRAGITLNCGYGRGFSVLDVIGAIERVTGRPLPVEAAPRRAGDVDRLIADPARLNATLAWRPRHDDLDGIVESALAWERHHLQSNPGRDTA